jgi:hypothetical protein
VPNTLNNPISAREKAGHLGREALVLEVAGHVHANEHHLKAAHEIACCQQQKAGRAHRLGQCLANALLALGRGRALKPRFAQAIGQRRDQ